MGVPALLVGFRLTSTPANGGLGLSFEQMILVMPFGLLLGSLFLAAIAYVAADTGLPTGMMLRPSMGVAGSWLGAVVATVFYLAWASLELQVGGNALAQIAKRAGLDLDPRIGIFVFSVVIGIFMYLGIQRISLTFVAKLGFWIALAIFVGTFFLLVSDGPSLSGGEAEQRTAWLGADIVFAFMVAWFPLAGDTARFSPTTESAMGGIGLGFGAGTGIVMVVGSVAGLVTNQSLSYAALTNTVLTGTSLVVVGAAFLWVVFGEADQPFGLLYGAAMSMSATVLRRPPGLLAEMLVIAAGGVGILVGESSLIRATDFLVSLVVPFGAVLLADFFVVRRRIYNLDALYDRTGMYRGMNLLGLVAYLVAFVSGQWISPSVPDAWASAAKDVFSSFGSLSGNYGVPAVFTSSVVAFLIYGVVGRWRIKEQQTVSQVRS